MTVDRKNSTSMFLFSKNMLIKQNIKNYASIINEKRNEKEIN